MALPADAHIARSRHQELELKVGDAVYFGFIDFQIYPRPATPQAAPTAG